MPDKRSASSLHSRRVRLDICVEMLEKIGLRRPLRGVARRGPTQTITVESEVLGPTQIAASTERSPRSGRARAALSSRSGRAQFALTTLFARTTLFALPPFSKRVVREPHELARSVSESDTAISSSDRATLTESFRTCCKGPPPIASTRRHFASA